ncbi:hypothetical protein G4O51_08050 [Candidatus Bathyarchaeota archaeon A05DMB-2]|jgi:hypothetical protein|nr:hypothetical protein [Candidatus Bathyarchaeota archaeon A05DMB-2]
MKNHTSTAKKHVSIYGSHEKKSKRWELEIDENNPKDMEALKLAVQHPPEQCFPRKNPYPKVVLGDWDTDMVKVDWDERFLCEVKRFSKILVKRFSVLGDGFIILKSSTKTRKIRNDTFTDVAYSYKSPSYHTVFNGEVSKVELESILAWLCLFTKDNGLITWFLLQLIKGTYTLRIGFKGKKKPPKIVFRYGNQDKQIKKFLENRDFILNFLIQSEKKR